jgi:hypothetical protein
VPRLLANSGTPHRYLDAVTSEARELLENAGATTARQPVVLLHDGY